jgi:hypothetical protein
MTDTDYIIQKMTQMAQMQKNMEQSITLLQTKINEIITPSIEYVTREEAGKYLHVSSSTIDKYRKDGKVVGDSRGMILFRSLVDYKYG